MKLHKFNFSAAARCEGKRQCGWSDASEKSFLFFISWVSSWVLGFNKLWRSRNSIWVFLWKNSPSRCWFEREPVQTKWRTLFSVFNDYSKVVGEKDSNINCRYNQGLSLTFLRMQGLPRQCPGSERGRAAWGRGSRGAGAGAEPAPGAGGGARGGAEPPRPGPQAGEDGRHGAAADRHAGGEGEH